MGQTTCGRCVAKLRTKSSGYTYTGVETVSRMYDPMIDMPAPVLELAAKILSLVELSTKFHVGVRLM
jgi:hypothetical protein